MRKARKMSAIWLCLMLSISCTRNNSIEGVWQGKVLEKVGGDTGPWTITLTRVGNSYSGELVGINEIDGKEIKSILQELNIEGQKISFIFGQTKCEGVFSNSNSELNGRCLFNLESIPNGYQKGEEMMVFELRKK